MATVMQIRTRSGTEHIHKMEKEAAAMDPEKAAEEFFQGLKLSEVAVLKICNRIYRVNEIESIAFIEQD